MTTLLSMAQTADALGMSYDAFRKAWPVMHAELDLPAPVRGRKWCPDALQAWKARRSFRALADAACKAIRPPPLSAADKARFQLDQLRRAG